MMSADVNFIYDEVKNNILFGKIKKSGWLVDFFFDILEKPRDTVLPNVSCLVVI